MSTKNRYRMPVPQDLLQRIDRTSSPAHVGNLRNAVDLSRKPKLFIVCIEVMGIIVIEYKNYSKVLKQYKENLNWFNYNYAVLRNRYLNRYVTINDKKIVESDRVLGELLERLKTNYHDSWYRFAIEFVDEEEPQICLIND
jgi:hypothetical protein